MLIGRLQVADRYQRQAGTRGRQVLEAGEARKCVRWPELTSAANRLKKGSKAGIGDHIIRPSAH